MVLDQSHPCDRWSYPGDSRSRPIRWLRSFVWRNTRGLILDLGSCSSCGRPALGPGTAWRSLETRSTLDRGRQSPSETRCRCSIPTLWIPQSRTEALHKEKEGREGGKRVSECWGRWKNKMFWMKGGGFGSERTVWIKGNEMVKVCEGKEEWNCSYSSHIIPMSVFYLNIKTYMDVSQMMSAATAGSRLMLLPPLMHVELVKFPITFNRPHFTWWRSNTSRNLLGKEGMCEWSLDRLRAKTADFKVQQN